MSRVLVVGAGEAGRMLVRELARDAEGGLDPVGFVDDEPGLQGRDVEGIPVLGACNVLAEAAAACGADLVILAVPSAERPFVRRMIARCRDSGLPYKIVPGILEIIRGPVRLEQLRDVRPEDLLGRESVEFDERAIARALAGKRVLVTGAGGSIGSEICRQVARYGPGGLVALGREENEIFELEAEVPDVEPVIADVQDREGLRRVFERVRPDFVYHAAAHKHVHYMERFPAEAIKNNVFGTANTLDAARAAGVGTLVLLSTDKAVRPTGVMGASKRLAEYLVSEGTGPTRALAVRFGNVLASRGSVVPAFMRQIERGGPVRVSHPDATRFFMSRREACGLVIQASVLGRGGETFVLRMGEPIRIAELAHDLIALCGLRPGTDVAIEFTGLRPGEKLHEDLVGDGEHPEASGHPRILCCRNKLPDGLDLRAALTELERLALAGDGDGIKTYLESVIPDADLRGR